MVDSHYLGYELSWEDRLLDGVDNFIHRVFQHAVTHKELCRNFSFSCVPNIYCSYCMSNTSALRRSSTHFW